MLRHLSKHTKGDVEAKEEERGQGEPTLFIHVIVYGMFQTEVQTKTVHCATILLNWSGLGSLPCCSSCFLCTALSETQ